jgi:hypothetical protein
MIAPDELTGDGQIAVDPAGTRYGAGLDDEAESSQQLRCPQPDGLGFLPWRIAIA